MKPIDASLRSAVKCGDEEKVRTLIAQGADVNLTSRSGGHSVLMLAVKNGYADVAEVLVEAGACTNTAFIAALQKGDLGMAEFLFRKVTIDINAKIHEGCYQKGWTVLMHAIGRVDAVEWLVGHGADLEARAEEDRTALIVAAENGHVDVVRILVGAGADFEARVKWGHQPRHYHGDLTALMEVAGIGHADVVDLLIESGADVNARDNERWSPLMHAADEDHVGVVKLLVKHGADVDDMDLLHSTGYRTARGGRRGSRTAGTDDLGDLLIAVAEGGLVETVSGILLHGGDVKIDKKDVGMALVCAVDKGHSDVVDLLIKAGADVDFADYPGWTPLMHAANRGYADIADLLIKAGARLDVTIGMENWTVLQVAASRGHGRVVDLLVRAGADVNAMDHREKDMYGW